MLAVILVFPLFGLYSLAAPHVLRLEIICGKNVSGGYEYLTEIKEVYKDFANWNLTVNKLVVLKMQKYLNFRSGRQYFVFAMNTQGSVYTKPCNGNVKVSDTSHFMKHGLREHYKANCFCTNSFTPYTRRKTCRWYYDYKVENRRACRWNGGTDYNTCAKRTVHHD